MTQKSASVLQVQLPPSGEVEFASGEFAAESEARGIGSICHWLEKLLDVGLVSSQAMSRPRPVQFWIPRFDHKANLAF